MKINVKAFGSALGGFVEVPKFLVGVLVIAIGLFMAGQLVPATLAMANKAAAAQKDHQKFKLGDLSRQLNR